MPLRAPPLSIILLVSVATTGCLGPRRADYQTSQPISVEDSSQRADALWTAALDTLRAQGLRLDRVDRRAGVITTLPESSQHFFEFWRHDVDTAPDFWEATVNPLRRRVDVNIVRGENGRWTKLAVIVSKQRFSSPDRQFNRTGEAYQYFGNRLPSTTGLARVTSEHDEWLDLGRDPAMEEYLLRAILRRAEPHPDS